MSEDDRNKSTRMVAKLFIAMLAAVGALVIAVWALGVKTRADVRDAARASQVAQTDQLRDGCARGVSRDFESYDANTDLISLANDVGNLLRQKDKAAYARSKATAENARGRRVRISERLPLSRSQADIESFCRSLYPYPPTLQK
jgi:hypothetical protein